MGEIGGEFRRERKKLSRFERFMSRYSSKESILDKIIEKELGPLDGPIKKVLKEEVKRELLRHPRYSEVLKKFIGILEKLQDFEDNLRGDDNAESK